MKTSFCTLLGALVATTLPLLSSESKFSTLNQLTTPAPAAEPDDRLPAPQITNWYDASQGSSFTIHFPIPMVEDAQVGRAAAAGVIRTNFDSCLTTKWDSPSALRVTITQSLPPLSVLRVTIPAQTGLNGRRVSQAKAAIPTHHYISISDNSCALSEEDVSDEPIFFCGYDEQDNACLAQAVPHMYYLVDESLRLPAQVRLATVADALKHWESYREVTNYCVREEDRQAFMELPGETPIPFMWYTERPGHTKPGEQNIRLIAPGIRYDENTEEYGPKTVVSWRDPSVPAYRLSNSLLSEDHYQVKLKMGLPAQMTDTESLVRSLKWSIREDAHSNAWIPLKWEDGALRARVRGKDFALTVEETPEIVSYRIASSGETLEGINSILLHAETGGREVRLKAEGTYTPILPTPYPKTDRDITTMLQPPYPHIYADVDTGCLRTGGGAVIQCQYGELKSGRARIWKLDDAPASAIRAISAYEQLYLNRGRQTSQDKQQPIVSTDQLPGILLTAEQELPPPAGKAQLDLRKLFPGQDLPGLYFVDIRGESYRKGKVPEPVVCQSLIQITDLGLVWKVSGDQLFAWAWHMSDASAVPSARLAMLDENGASLGELEVRNGLVQGRLQPGTRFFLLSTESDSVILQTRDNAMKEWAAADYRSYMDYCLTDDGINPADCPKNLIFLFSDRNLYRPGETAHIKGIVRTLTGNELTIPAIEQVTATISSGTSTSINVPLNTDGSFSFDAPLPAVGGASVRVKIKYTGDDTLTSPDYAFFTRHGWDPDEKKSLLKNSSYAIRSLLENSRSEYLHLPVEEFRRNEFEVKSQLEADSDTRQIRISTTATNFTTTPVAHGKVSWRVNVLSENFYPKGWQEYRFGDFRQQPWAYFYAYYRNGYHRYNDRQYVSKDGNLDANGHGETSLQLPALDFPARTLLIATSTVTNGNGQSIRSVRKTTLDPADAYAGIRAQDRLLHAGETLKTAFVAVKPDGTPWDGQPLQATVTATHTVYHSYRYGAKALSAYHNVKDDSETYTANLLLTGQPTEMEIPLPSAGIWDITIRGTDSQGRPFCSATRHYAYGDSVSPWERQNGESLALEPDKEIYQAGETAHILVQTPVDAELLVCVEREKVMRHFHRTVTISNPVIDIPLEAGDSPQAYVSVFLVQSANNRAGNGDPLIKLGSTPIRIFPADKKLDIRMEPSSDTFLPKENCTVRGTVTGADGSPVPHALVTLYAEDEGALQVSGYTLPDPLSFFYQERVLNVDTYSSLRGLISSQLRRREFGNKGTFIGGGGEAGDSAAVLSDEEQKQLLRTDFNPCALWLAEVQTDDQGQFTATYANPDTLTRYRLMAVAAAGDRFGADESSYHVIKPVMLEPAAPLSATEGDMLEVPVTISMLPQDLGVANDTPVRWTIRLEGEGVALPETEQTIELTGNAPVTVTFPVSIPKGSAQDTARYPKEARLTWSVKAAESHPSGMLARAYDAVQLSFPVVPPAPQLKERICARLTDGSTSSLAQWLKTDFRENSPVELTFSTNPLAGIRYALGDLFAYPYGCTEQLSSTLLPWLFRDELTHTLGVEFPKDKNAATLISQTLGNIKKRALPNGEFAYWDGASTPCAFSPYVVLVLSYAYETGNAPRPPFETFTTMRRRLLDQSGDHPNLLSAWVLARSGKIRKEDIDTLYARLQDPESAGHGSKPSDALLRTQINPQEPPQIDIPSKDLWLLAISARQLNHPKASLFRDLALQAENQSGKDSGRWGMPPTEALHALYAILDAPHSPETALTLQACLDAASEQSTTWNNAWLAIVVHEYLRTARNETASAVVNGEGIDNVHPLQLDISAGHTEEFSSSGDTVYINGYAEGYLKQEQPAAVVDNGFNVQRRYEVLLPDGTWKPTGKFSVGDTVRVTLTTKISQNNPGGYDYFVLEDRLPSAFEAINPELDSQALPEGIRGWESPGCVDHREFLKDRVRFFSTRLGTDTVTTSYVARVVRRGKVTAPAAKAELMYLPQVYGLSIPQQFEIGERK